MAVQVHIVLPAVQPDVKLLSAAGKEDYIGTYLVTVINSLRPSDAYMRQ